MAGKIFSKFGAKRSLNLADLPDKKEALNNLLDKLADSTETFTWEDINLLRFISLTDISSSTFTSASDATVKLINSSGILTPYNPLITLENRFDKAYFTTSEPYFAGGNGLSASYFDSNSIQRATENDPASDFTGFDTSLLVRQDNFWERGNFSYENKISVDFVSLYGGVQWEGYFKPSQDGNYSLRIRTGGFLKVEFDNKLQPRTFTPDAATGTFNYANNDFTQVTTLVDDTKLDQSTDLSTAVRNSSGIALNTNHTYVINLGTLVQWEAYKIRITYFTDPNAYQQNESANKSIDINISSPSGTSNLNYKQLFTKNYFQNYNIGDFKEFVEKSVSLGGTEIGSKGTIGDVQASFTSSPGQKGDSYRNLSNINPTISYYQFPKQISDVETVIQGCNVQNNIQSISINNAQADSTEGIEIGNYVIGSGIQPGTRVTNVVINSNIVVSPAPNNTTSNTPLTFVDHRGLVAFGTGDVYGDKIDTITNSYGLSNIDNNQIVLSSSLSFTYDSNIDNTTNNTAVGILLEDYTGSVINFKNASSSSSIGNQKFYVYETLGLVDSGLKNFCQGVLKARLIATQNDTASNSINITVDDVTGITTNMYVHAFPAVNFGTRLDGTVNELFSKVQVTNISGTTLTLTGVGGVPVLLSGLEYNSEKIKNIVFTSTDVNKEVCFRPTDTSPPFAANAAGLTTPFNVSLVNDFTSNSGGVLNNSSKVTYSALEIKHDTGNIANNISAYASETISDYLPIEDSAGNTFYILLGS
tara:strand:+ start:90 stop:2366 length:2277 start_codon:yes stop_codon:yes gene_type:complete